MNDEVHVYCPINDLMCPYYNINTDECTLGADALECDDYCYYHNDEEEEE